MIRKTVAAAMAVLTTALVATPAEATPAAAPDCGIEWGSGAKVAGQSIGGPLVDLRAGQHECYDRLVFDVRKGAPGYHVSYVDEVTEDGSGDPVPLRGQGKLQITVNSPAYDEDFDPTYRYADPAELVDVPGFRTFRQVAWAGSWEGTTSVGLGVRARLPFRVFVLDNHVVVDVAHSW